MTSINTENLRKSFSRRQFVQQVAATTAALTATAIPQADTTTARAQGAKPGIPAMRSPHHAVVQAANSEVTLPSLPVIALNRMGFGARPGDIDGFIRLGASPQAALQVYVEQQLNPTALADSECDAKLAQQGFSTLNKSRPQLWVDHHQPPNLTWEDRIRPADETLAATFLRAVYSKRQLLELLADFWHNHFNVFAFDYWTAPQFVHYDRDVIRANIFGNFGQMLKAVATSTAMLYYLDNTSNTSAGPNENYARELFELHTMGAENYGGVVSDRSQVPVDSQGRPTKYIDKDIYQATQCFTGWRIDEATGDFKFEDNVHTKYEKTVLGAMIGDFQGVRDGEIVLDLLANHPGTARYVCRKLCRRLINDNPPEDIVQAAADVFYAQRNAPDQLKQVVRTILLSEGFRTTWGQKIKRPFDYVVSLLRASNADLAVTSEFLWIYGTIGQPLFQWHPPNGYPDSKEAWATTMPMLQRWRRCNWMLLYWSYGGDGLNKDTLRIRLAEQMPGTVTTPTQIVDYWSTRFLGYTLPESERRPIIEFMAHGRNPDYDLPADQIEERLSSMAGLILMSPSFLWK